MPRVGDLALASELTRKRGEGDGTMTPSLAIRPATSADRKRLRDAIVELQNFERALHPSRLPGEEVADAYLDWMLARSEQSGGVLIAEDAGCFLGFVAGWIEEHANIAETPASKRFGYISDICVVPAFRGRRVAERLLEAIELHLKLAGVEYLRLDVLAANGSARTSYERAGFVPYEVRYEKRLNTVLG